MRLINLIPLQEIDFPSQGAFDRYNQQHKLRPDTKVVVAGRVTTAGRASQNSPTPAKDTSVFGGEAPKAGEKPKAQLTQPQPGEAPSPGKLSGKDFQSSAEKNVEKEKPQRPGADDMKLKTLMPGIDTPKQNNDDVDISDYKTDGEGTVLYKGKKVADYVYSPNTDVFITKTPNGREYFDTQEDMFKYLQKNKDVN
jgi:hypothetical protein